MANHDKNNESPAARAGTSRVASSTKKRYEKPRVLYREPLEAMAALCTPAPPGKASPGTCSAGPINS